MAGPALPLLSPLDATGQLWLKQSEILILAVLDVIDAELRQRPGFPRTQEVDHDQMLVARHRQMFRIEGIGADRVAQVHVLHHELPEEFIAAKAEELGVKAVIDLMDAAEIAPRDGGLVFGMDSTQQRDAGFGLREP